LVWGANKEIFKARIQFIYDTNPLKKILIIYPHFPPSNLAGVHRPRLFAQHLPEFGWEPIVLTVDEQFYEEEPDYNLVKLLPKDLRIEKVGAWKVTKPRLIGDIGIRGFFQLYKKAKQLILTEKIDLVFISIPSFYVALLGRLLHASTGVAYGIDYIDPWVHEFAGSDKVFSRHWFSTRIANFLEPIAVKKAALITGVAEGYYTPVLERNASLKKSVTGAMPYGGEAKDHAVLASMDTAPYLFQKIPGTFQFVYAGAMLPKAYEPLRRIFDVIKNSPEQFTSVEFHFIGTGSSPKDDQSYNIKAMAMEFGLWQTVVFEYPKRIPYLDVLIHLKAADAVFILGSTEPHYTPSKVYQAILSEKPALAVLHQESTAVTVLQQSNGGKVLAFDGVKGLDTISANFASCFNNFIQFSRTFDPAQVDTSIFDNYSAKAVTKTLAGLLDKVIARP
jgi:hypothetical protein